MIVLKLSSKMIISFMLYVIYYLLDTWSSLFVISVIHTSIMHDFMVFISLQIHHNTPSDVYAKKIYTMMPKTPLLAKQKVKKKLTHLEELNTHSFTVKWVKTIK